MKNILKLGFILMAYAGIAGVLLGWVYTKTKPKIDLQEKLEREQAIREVLPDGIEIFEENTLDDGTVLIIGYSDDSKQNVLGYAAMAVGTGFSSNVRTMLGLTPDFKVNAIKVIYQSETPGLGTHSQDSWFQKQFSGKTKGDLLVNKDGGKIEAITGATISSRAVTNSVRELVEKLSHNPKLTRMQKTAEDTLSSDNSSN
ncbi:RnfABCDGE type electron transport complex subunit G [bacterium]|nr:RnfABCDGE type electron transport complex subunit G [bacterium]